MILAAAARTCFAKLSFSPRRAIRMLYVSNCSLRKYCSKLLLWLSMPSKPLQQAASHGGPAAQRTADFVHHCPVHAKFKGKHDDCKSLAVMMTAKAWLLR